MPYADARPVFLAVRDDLWPAPLRGMTEAARQAAWPAWAAKRDAEVRDRVDAGEADSVIHLLLFGTSFTRAPRATDRELTLLAMRPAEAIAVLRPRIDDFTAAVLNPATDERLEVARRVMRRAGVEPTAANRPKVQQYLEQRAAALGRDGAAQLQAMLHDPTGNDTIYRQRGLSSDTTFAIDFGVERALEELRARKVFAPGSISRVAIVAPGLDFIDKQNGYDFYPQQTIQPFAVIDSLLRLGLAPSAGIRVTAFDVAPRVIEHINAARAAAATGKGYTLVLPRSRDRGWTPPLLTFYQRLGQRIGEAQPPERTPKPPSTAGRVDVRSVVVRPAIAQAVSARDLNIVLEQANSAAVGGPFDLVVATNILLYYDVFEQSLALANIAHMVRPGGVLLSNDRLVELPSSPMTGIGYTDTIYSSTPGEGDAGDRVYSYQRPLR